jgi:tRNA (cytosine38-C5)-methyltransferase
MTLPDLHLKLRFFTPIEIMKFMSFSPNFSFPNNLSVKSQYKLLGNSINVKVVNILLKYLLFAF